MTAAEAKVDWSYDLLDTCGFKMSYKYYDKKIRERPAMHPRARSDYHEVTEVFSPTGNRTVRKVGRFEGEYHGRCVIDQVSDMDKGSGLFYLDQNNVRRGREVEREFPPKIWDNLNDYSKIRYLGASIFCSARDLVKRLHEDLKRFLNPKDYDPMNKGHRMAPGHTWKKIQDMLGVLQNISGSDHGCLTKMIELHFGSLDTVLKIYEKMDEKDYVEVKRMYEEYVGGSEVKEDLIFQPPRQLSMDHPVKVWNKQNGKWFEGNEPIPPNIYFGSPGNSPGKSSVVIGGGVSAYEKITNPLTGRKVKTDGFTGKKVIEVYGRRLSK